jgi:large subunit ribosomal protein L5
MNTKVKFNLQNDLSIPKLLKVVVSISTKDVINDSRAISQISNTLYLITGQLPSIIKAKKSISAFKLREGIDIAAKVTLRKGLMYEFIDRLVNIVLPRIRDFRGLDINKFDGNGNYSFGIREQIIFPEIEYDKVDKIRGLGIVIVTSTKNNVHAKFLLEQFSFPFIN